MDGLATNEQPKPPVPDWLLYLLGDTSLLQAVFWIAAICALIVALVKLWPVLSNLVHIVNAVTGLPQFISRTDESIERLRHQVENDHDTNLRDELTQALEATERLEEGVTGLYKKVDELVATDEKLAAADDELRRELEDTHPTNRKETP